MATVLVVEDDKLSQRILGKILGGAGHETLVAESVANAWDMLRGHPLVDLVILDNQLGKEWGWTFLQGLRADPVFSGLPVAVYTAHTERSSIMKYVELGVQAMLVKPYKGEVLFEELKKAGAVDWTGRLLERPAVACARLKISESDYYSTLSAAATELEKSVQGLRDAIAARREDQMLREPVQKIFNQSAALGMPVLRNATEGLVRAIGSKHTPTIQAALRSLESLQTLLRQRSMEYIGVKAMAGGGSDVRAAKRPAATHDAVIPAAASQAAAYCRRTAGSPVWAYGKGFARLEGRELFAKGELGKIAAGLVEQSPLREMVEAHRFIASAPNAGLDDVVKEVEELPKFRELYLKIATKLAGGTQIEPEVRTEDDGPIDREAEAEAKRQELRLALDRLGVFRTMVIVAAARVAKGSRVKSPLDLSMLLEHTLAVAILSYEVGRMLRLPDEHLPAAAGLVHDLGKWVFALAEPGLYALVLTLAHEGGQGVSRAEQGIFGATHEEAGRLALEAAHAPVLLLDAAVAHEDLTRVSKPESVAVVASVFLANHLAWAAVAEETHAKAIRDALLNPQNQLWGILEDAGVSLPMDIPELIEAMVRVSKSATWISGELIEWAGAK